ncbi:hypothetical protein IAQ61_002188 [Plenodomus lingam]|uniref:uncharacterized protein n=1 Tax=Leptosphaeria maculans TaxID=5022 RepID=UPI003316A109|nr:hypothetical protein IAQ61_002188 [Plenodomus lingam]
MTMFPSACLTVFLNWSVGWLSLAYFAADFCCRGELNDVLYVTNGARREFGQRLQQDQKLAVDGTRKSKLHNWYLSHSEDDLACRAQDEGHLEHVLPRRSWA